jgi:hypothetical protein
MGTTPIYGFPYPDPSDLVANYPALGQQLAEDVESTFLTGVKVLQVVSTLKQDTFTTSSTSYTDVTGLSVSITPGTATNKILVIASLSLGATPTGYATRGAILRGSTIVGAGTAVGSRSAASFAQYAAGASGAVSQTFQFLDSPATTSATTYKIQVAAESSGTAQVGIGIPSDGNFVQFTRLASTITVMEIAA